MSHDAVIRSAAVVAAIALLAAPYRQQIAAWFAQAAAAAKAHRASIGRLAAAALLIAAAYGKVPVPHVPFATGATIEVATPSAEMQTLVQPIAKALKPLPLGDRLLWAATWHRAGIVVRGDAVTAEAVFTDTRSLRVFTTLALDIAWRRIGGHAPGSVAGLREAVEASYGQCVGTDVVPVTADVRGRYAAFCDAVAWAGLNGG